MSKFDYMNFNIDGWDTELVVNAKKFSKEEAVVIFMIENAHILETARRKPTIEDVTERTVRWYPRVPDWCSYDGDEDNGCYSYCRSGERGSFPVWVIEFELLEV